MVGARTTKLPNGIWLKDKAEQQCEATPFQRCREPPQTDRHRVLSAITEEQADGSRSKHDQPGDKPLFFRPDDIHAGGIKFMEVA